MTTIVKRRAQRGLSMIGFLFVAAVALVVALLAFLIVKHTVGLRVGEDAEREGLDIASHGESAYES